jgi:uncharacterized protein (TIGR02646 family)
MINRITATFKLTLQEQLFINSLIPFQPGIWNNQSIFDIKANIHSQLLKIQNDNCCYCGLKVNEGGRAEIEHIANKGGPKRPAYIEFVFTEENLAIACQFCNSSSKKGQVDILDYIDLSNYNSCTIKIVHPYFDNPDLHYRWSKGDYKILISYISLKGKESIKLFQLDSEAHTLARAKQAMYEEKLAKYKNREKIRQRVLEILKFKI